MSAWPQWLMAFFLAAQIIGAAYTFARGPKRRTREERIFTLACEWLYAALMVFILYMGGFWKWA